MPSKTLQKDIVKLVVVDDVDVVYGIRLGMCDL